MSLDTVHATHSAWNSRTNASRFLSVLGSGSGAISCRSISSPQKANSAREMSVRREGGGCCEDGYRGGEKRRCWNYDLIVCVNGMVGRCGLEIDYQHVRFCEARAT